jgi:recombination protein RecT
MADTNDTTIAPKKDAMALMKSEEVKKKFSEVLGNNSSAYVTTVLQVIAQSDMLREANPSSVYAAAMTAASLSLPVNPNLGFAYIIPYKSKD